MTFGCHYQRTARGASSVAVAIIVSVGALLLLTTTLVVLSRLRDSVAEESRVRAQASAEALLDAYEARLSADPFRFLTEVDAAEWSRVCDQGGGEPTEVEPGAAWPAECGVSWTYARKEAAVDGGRLEVIPPTVNDPHLTVRAVGQAGKVEVAVRRSYTLPHVGRYALWVEGDLNLADIVGGTFRGDIYTGGSLHLPVGEVEQLMDRGVFIAEEGIYPTAPKATATAVWVEGEEVRRRVPSPLALDYAAEQVTILAEFICGSPAELCLAPGVVLVDRNGIEVAIPADTKSFAVRPTTDGGVTYLEVFSSTRQVKGRIECLLRCSLPSLAAPAVADATGHPAVLNSGWWTPLGEFQLPEAGVVYTAGDLVVGGCGAAFVSADSSCETVSFDTPLTLLAGTTTNPQDIWIGGPIGGEGVVGLIATGGVRIPFWARPPGGDLDVKAVAVGMRDGLVFTPEVVVEGLVGSADSQGGTLRWHGSVVAKTWPEKTNQFRQTTFTHNPELFEVAPPYMVGFGEVSIAHLDVRLESAVELCGGSCFGDD